MRLGQAAPEGLLSEAFVSRNFAVEPGLLGSDGQPSAPRPAPFVTVILTVNPLSPPLTTMFLTVCLPCTMETVYFLGPWTCFRAAFCMAGQSLRGGHPPWSGSSSRAVLSPSLALLLGLSTRLIQFFSLLSWKFLWQSMALLLTAQSPEAFYLLGSLWSFTISFLIHFWP